MNYSLFDNITCTGFESSLSQCVINNNTACTPFCWRNNLGLRCYGKLFIVVLLYCIAFQTVVNVVLKEL